MKNILTKRFLKLLILFLCILFLSAFRSGKIVSLKKECTKNLLILADDLIKIQNHDTTDINYGALYCTACSDYHSRASESVLPFAV
ncbi:MAG: hypothetical protein P8Z35_03800, partial [Ignavibacteriaceae bacterium]